MTFYKKYILIFIGFLISIVFLWLAFKNIPLKDIVSYFIDVNYYLIFLSVLVIILSFLLRAIRWQIFLSKKEKILKVFHVMMTGFMLNCVVPGRAGEIARPVMISRNKDIAFTEALSTIAVERLFDLIILLMFFFILILFVNIPDDLSYKFGAHVLNKQLLQSYVLKMGFMAMVIFTGILLLFFINRKNLFSFKFLQKFKNIFDNIITGITQLKTTNGLIKTITLSFLIWFLQICSYYIVVKACANININFIETAFVMVIICFFIAIPSVPGFWGVWEAGGIFAMSVLGIAKIDSAGFNLFNHAVQMVPVIIIGIISAWIIGCRINK